MPVSIGSFRIRDFRPHDFDALWQIDQICFPPGISYSRLELRAYLRQARAFTLVTVQDEETAKLADRQISEVRANRSSVSEDDRRSIVGFIIAEANRRAGHIITIDVIANARRHGVGSMLLHAAEDRLRNAGCDYVELETAVDNISAISFYKRHGYCVIETIPHYYSNGVDALTLQKPL
jgi:[ribosomal protein S18]-alanine N-acetyltransferase